MYCGPSVLTFCRMSRPSRHPSLGPRPLHPRQPSPRVLALLPAWLVSVGLQTCSDLIVSEEGHVAWVVDGQELPVLEECWPWLRWGSAWVRECLLRKQPTPLVPTTVQEPRHLPHSQRYSLRNIFDTEDSRPFLLQNPGIRPPAPPPPAPKRLGFRHWPCLTWKSLVKMSNSNMDTWPLQVRSIVERKARVVQPGSTGWQRHRCSSNSAQGTTHLGARAWGEGAVGGASGRLEWEHFWEGGNKGPGSWV